MNTRSLVQAARDGSFETAAELLTNRPDQVGGVDLNDALCEAAFNGHAEIVLLLLRHGADVNARNGNDLTPLDCAVENMHGEIVRLLLSAGADVNTRDSFGVTPLHRAIDIEVEDSNYAYDVEGVTRPPSTSITAILIEHGADPDATDKEGETPLQWAAKLGHEAGVELLRSRRAGPPPSSGH